MNRFLRLLSILFLVALGSGALAQTDSSNAWQLWGRPTLASDQSPPPPSTGMTGGWSRYFIGQTKCSNSAPEGYTTCIYINGDGALGSYGGNWSYWEWASGTTGYNAVYFRNLGCGPMFVAYPLVSESDKTFGRIPGNWTVVATGNHTGGWCGP